MTKSDKITPTQFGLFAAALAVFLLARCTESYAADSALLETRYLDQANGEVIKRNAKGEIIRRTDVLRAFQAIHPCPSTGKTTGACPGWAIDHVIPLNNNGRDSLINLQWLPNVLKSGKGRYPKDRWERIINAPTFTPVIMPASGVLTIQ